LEGFQLIADTPPRQVDQGRFEFRVWPRVWPHAVILMQKYWPLVGAERRSDVYLVTTRSPLCLVKLRGGTLLERKQRGRDIAALQCWTHESFGPFPLAPPVVRALASDLQVAGLPPDAGRSPGQLVTCLRTQATAVRAVPVRKSRLIFRKDDTRLEICRVVIAGRPRLTLAIEDSDPDRALKTVDALGIGHLPNLSYGDVLGTASLLSQSRYEGFQIEQPQRNTP